MKKMLIFLAFIALSTPVLAQNQQPTPPEKTKVDTLKSKMAKKTKVGSASPSGTMQKTNSEINMPGKGTPRIGTPRLRDTTHRGIKRQNNP